MHLALSEAASYFDVPESRLRRWIRTRGLPVHRIDERLYCNAIELWEWALETRVPVSKELLQVARRSRDEAPSLAVLLAEGGIHRDIGGVSKREVFEEVVERLPLPADVDREFLVDVLDARETMGSTGIGDGIAIPHVRNPILLHVTTPFVSLCLLRHPIEFGAPDHQPVSALFVLVCPTIPLHLRILAKLAFVLRDDELRRLLRSAAPSQAVLDRITALDAGIPGQQGMNPPSPSTRGTMGRE
jgi:PTS system nitrogen regulatory IIA component